MQNVKQDMKTETKKYDFEEMILLAFTVHRYNNGYYKENISVNTNDGFRKITGNKHIIYYMVENQWISSKHGIGDIKIEINDDDRKNAHDAIEWIKGLTFDAIAGRLAGYKNSLYNLSGKDGLEKEDFGRIACVPKVYNDVKQRDEKNDYMLEHCYDSGWVGNILKKVKLTVKVVEHFRYTQNGYHSYICITDNNECISFWSKLDLSDKRGKKIRIRGRVKSFDYYKDLNNVKETRLNHVKVL